MPGQEKVLPLELLDAFAGREPRSSAWKEGAGEPRSVLFGGGSGNLPLFRAAIKLYMDEPGAMEWWARYFDASEDGWEGREFNSPYTYGDWIPLCVLAVRRWARESGHRALLDLVDRWLLAYWSVIAGTQAPDGTVARCGMRGAGEHAPQPGPGALRELVAELGLYMGPAAESLAPWALAVGRGACAALAPGSSGKAPKPTPGSAGPAGRAVLRWDRANYSKPERAMFFSLAQDLRETAAPVRQALARGRTAFSCWPGQKLMVELATCRASGVIGVWINRNVNSNTPPILGAVWRQGKWGFLPENGGGWRVRQVMDRATCSLVGPTLLYLGDKFPTASLEATGLGIELLGGVSVPPPDPPPPPTAEDEDPPNPPSWWERLKAWWRNL